MTRILLTIAALFVFGCSTAQLDGAGIPPDGIGDACQTADDDDCVFHGLDFCTSSLGGWENQPPHAFCTRECQTDADCCDYRSCSHVPWSTNRTRVCVPNEWMPDASK